MEISSLQLATGIDIPIPSLGITLRQPRIKDIAILDESPYFLALSLSQVSKETLKISRDDVNEYDIFLHCMQQQVEGVILPQLMENFLKLFFVNPLIIGPRSLIFKVDEDAVSVSEESFVLLRSLIGQVGGASMLKKSKEEEFKPKNSRAAAIAEKMKKSRARKAAQQPKLKTSSILQRMINIVAIGTNLTFEEISNLTLTQLDTLYQGVFRKEEYWIEIKSRLAGAKGENKLIHWSEPKEEETPPTV